MVQFNFIITIIIILFVFFWAKLIVYMLDVGDVTVGHVQTELGDNGTKPEGGWARSTERSNLRKLNKSWPWRGFIIQHSGLLSCPVTEPGGAPLGVNSQAANQIIPFILYVNSICEVLLFPGSDIPPVACKWVPIKNIWFILGISCTKTASLCINPVVTNVQKWCGCD